MYDPELREALEGQLSLDGTRVTFTHQPDGNSARVLGVGNVEWYVGELDLIENRCRWLLKSPSCSISDKSMARNCLDQVAEIRERVDSYVAEKERQNSDAGQNGFESKEGNDG